MRGRSTARLSIQQPMIEPLYGGRSVLEVAAMVAGREPAKGYDLVKAYWTAQWPAAEREKRVEGGAVRRRRGGDQGRGT